MASFIDTHTHLYTEEFDPDREAVISRAFDAGAAALLLPNIDEASVEPMLRLCRAYPGRCYPMLGLHPTELPADPAAALARLERLLRPGHPYVAIGEVGLDYYWDDSRRSEQLAAFECQAQWAVRHDLPLMIHCRAAHEDMVDVLRPLAAQVSGVFHCFGGTEAEAAQLLSTFPDFMLGIGGVVTFKKSTLPQVLRQAVPLERIVLETDAPYLAPTPHRGRRNEPAWLLLVISRLADVYDTTPEAIAAQTTANARRIFPTILPQ